MYYKVLEEECGQGIKSRFSIGQIIGEDAINQMKEDFKSYMRDIYDDRTNSKFKFYTVGLFRKTTLKYYVNLLKK